MKIAERTLFLYGFAGWTLSHSALCRASLLQEVGKALLSIGIHRLSNVKSNLDTSALHCCWFCLQLFPLKERHLLKESPVCLGFGPCSLLAITPYFPHFYCSGADLLLSSTNEIAQSNVNPVAVLVGGIVLRLSRFGISFSLLEKSSALCVSWSPPKSCLLHL